MPEEAVSVAERLEVVVKAEARERELAGVKQEPCGNLPQGKVRDIVARQVGMKGSTYERAKEVVEAARAEPEKYGKLLISAS